MPNVHQKEGVEPRAITSDNVKRLLITIFYAAFTQITFSSGSFKFLGALQTFSLALYNFDRWVGIMHGNDNEPDVFVDKADILVVAYLIRIYSKHLPLAQCSEICLPCHSLPPNKRGKSSIDTQNMFDSVYLIE